MTLPCPDCDGFVRHDRGCDRYDPAKQVTAPGGFCLPVVADPRMPSNAVAVVGKTARVFMAPAGTGLDEPDWTDVGHTIDGLAFDAGLGWDDPADDYFAGLRSLRTDYTATLTATVRRSRPKDRPAVAPYDVFDLLYGIDPHETTGRVPARRAALAAIAVACHRAGQRIVVERAERHAQVAAMRRAIAETYDVPLTLVSPRDADELARWARVNHYAQYAFPVLSPESFTKITWTGP